MKAVVCWKCAYAWKSRKAKPKACPRCKTRLDRRPCQKGLKMSQVREVKSRGI